MLSKLILYEHPWSDYTEFHGIDRGCSDCNMVVLCSIYFACVYFEAHLQTGQCSVDEFLHTHVLQIYQNVGNNLLFQQDNASTHTFNLARNCLHASHINTLDWPSRSSDLPKVILGRHLYPFQTATSPLPERQLFEKWQSSTQAFFYKHAK